MHGSMNINLVDDMASLRGALFRRNTDCWVAVLVPPLGVADIRS